MNTQRGSPELETGRRRAGSGTNHPTFAERVGRRLFPWRIFVGLIAVIVGGFVIRPRKMFGEYEDFAMVISAGLVLCGLGLRAWSAAAAGGHTRTETIEAPSLVTAGPYAFVRNPIYLGSFTLGLGMIGLLGDPWLLLPHLLVFAVFFGAIVPAEERFLAQTFGEEYARFCRNVPRFVPNWRAWRSHRRAQLKWKAAVGELWIALLLLTIYMTLVQARQWVD